jgi:hypothetical protein
MPTLNERLAGALDELRSLQQGGARVFASRQLTRAARERLVKHGFLREVMKGWLISASPTESPGDTTPWFASFWEFCRRYCDERFGESWYLSPEQSLLLHAENTVIPKQLVVHSPRANNNRVDLLFGTSFFALKVRELPPARDLETKHGMRVFAVASALTRATEGFFAQHPVEAEIVLGGIRDPSALLARLLEGGHATIAGRLAGAFRRLGDPSVADEIVAAMRAADHDVRETDPFDPDRSSPPLFRSTPPIVARLKTLWASNRAAVLDRFPEAPGLPRDRAAYLKAIDDVYKLDAYHSLSIEGYQVTSELVERVATGRWDPDRISSDRESSNALAARGYWLAFQRVRRTVERVVSGGATDLLRVAHREWYREMFSPHVAVGLLPAPVLAGYRNQPVFLRGSRHVPPRWELLGDAMPALFDLIEREQEPAVRAVLGHWLFGYVHPFPDGNGRIARFVMNVLLAAGGYPWTIIRVEDRSEYLAALERASVDLDVEAFASFVAEQQTKGAGSAKATRRPGRRSRRAPPRCRSSTGW